MLRIDALSIPSAMLSLDQCLRKHWSCLTTFGTSTGWLKMEHPGGAEIAGSQLILWACGPSKGFTRVYVMGYGMSTHGFTHV
jgi:hypothetical protein